MEACHGCGKENPLDVRFCHWCGIPLRTSSTTGHLPPQMLLQNGRYLITELLGQGGMGAVYKALDLNMLQKAVAIKEMSQKGLFGRELQEAIQAFTQEAKLLASFSHHSLPRIYQQFEENGRRYLVMEFIEGMTLEQYLENWRQTGKQIPVEQILDIGIQLCVALDYLHTQTQPVIFRDLKPSNCMLTPQGKVYLIDFGIVRLFKPGQVKDTVALGSPGYAAPEQYRKATSPRSDIYSLGAILHQLLTGDDPAHTPFHFKPLALSISMLEDLVMSMVEVDEFQRPASMKRVQKVLQSVAQELPVSKMQGGYRQKMREVDVVSSIRPVDIYVLISPAVRDQQIWKSMQDQLGILINAIPNVRIRYSDALSQQVADIRSAAIENADLILILLSEDFLSSSVCMVDAERAIEQTRAHGVRVQSLLLRACAWQKTSLAHVPLVYPDAIAHLNLYAQEQCILEVARSICVQIASLVLTGKRDGPMNLLQWLLWRLYRNDGNHSPYFVVEQYVLKYIRPSGHAGALFRLFHRWTGHAIADYSIGTRSSTRLAELLHIIAPTCTVPEDVQGIAMRERPG